MRISDCCWQGIGISKKDPTSSQISEENAHIEIKSKKMRDPFGKTMVSSAGYLTLTSVSSVVSRGTINAAAAYFCQLLL